MTTSAKLPSRESLKQTLTDLQYMYPAGHAIDLKLRINQLLACLELLPYVQHKKTCWHSGLYGLALEGKNTDCTCGLADLLKSLGIEGGGG
jgi:hypothetical protein